MICQFRFKKYSIRAVDQFCVEDIMIFSWMTCQFRFILFYKLVGPTQLFKVSKHHNGHTCVRNTCLQILEKSFVSSDLFMCKVRYVTFKPLFLFPERVANPINKQARSTSLFIGFAGLEGNISCIWKSMWINQYITLFFIEHSKLISICFDFPSVLMFWKSLCWSIATITRKDKLNLNFYGRHFVLKRTRLPLTDPWIGSAFYFYSNCVSGYWSRRSQIHNGQSGIWSSPKGRCPVYIDDLFVIIIRMVPNLQRFISLQEINIFRLLRNSIFILTGNACISL